MQLGEDSDLLPAARSTPLLTADEILELARHDATVCLQRWWKRRRHHNHQRIAELREHLCRHATSLIEKRRQSRIRAKIRDIVIHLVFLYVYTVSTHHGHKGEQLFRLIQAVRSSYSRESAQRFSDISSQADLVTWLNGPFLEATYVSPPPLLSRVGGVRIGQLRVTRSNCSSRAASFFPTALNMSSGADFYCYGADNGVFDTENENTAAFGGITGSSFPFLGLNDTNADTERKEYFSSMQTPTNTDQSYPAPAYSVVLPRSDISQAREVLSWLRHDAYVDAYTRTVMIDVNLYSIMLRHVIAVRFLVEFLPPSGDGAVTTLSINAVPLTRSFLLDLDSDISWTTNNLVLLAFYSYFLVSELLSHMHRRRRKRGLSSNSKRLRWSNRNGSFLRILSLVVYFLVWLFRLFTLLKLPSDADSSDQYVCLRPFTQAFLVSQSLLAVNTCLCWWILVLLLRVTRSVDLFVRTLSLAKTKLCMLLICLSILLYGYASASLIVLGPSSSRFRSIPQALNTFVALLLATSRLPEDDGNDVGASSSMQALLMACFLVLNVFIIANVFLVVVYNAYRQAIDEMAQKQNSNDQFDLPVETFRYFLAMYKGVKDRLVALFRRCFPKRDPSKSPPKRGPGAFVVRAISKATVVRKSKRMLVGQVDALAGVGDKLVRSATAKLHTESDVLGFETLRERSTGGLRSHFNDTHRTGQREMKLLQGMILQLALQNEMLQRSVDELRNEIRHSSSEPIRDETRTSSTRRISHDFSGFRPPTRRGITETMGVDKVKLDDDDETEEELDEIMTIDNIPSL